VARKSGSKSVGAKHPAAARPRPAWHAWLRHTVVTLLAIVAGALFLPFDRLLPLLSAPLVLGLLAGSWERRPAAAAAVGAASGLAGYLVLLGPYDVQRFATWVQTQMPKYAVLDTTRDIFDFTIATVQANPLVAMGAGGQSWPLGVLMVGLCAAVAALAAWWRSESSRERRTAWLAWTAVALIAGSFVYTAWAGTADFRQRISTEPADGTYAYDPVFNLKTYYMMRRGVGFYDAYMYSTLHDSRHANTPTAPDGRLVSGSPMFLRPPGAWYLWRVVGAGGSDGIVLFSILCCAAVLVGVYPAMRPTASTRAAFVSVMLYPGLLLHTVWFNIFFPDWWAALALLGSAVLLVARRYWAAGALAFLAVVFREVAGFYLLVMIVAGAICRIRGAREWLARTLAYAGGLLAAAGLFAWHYASGLRFFTPQPQAAFDPLGAFAANRTRGYDWKLLAPTSYLMLPYGMYAVPALLLMPASAAGFWFALPKGSAERFALAGYQVAMLALFLTVGATSSYWGQLVMPLAVMGTGLLLARADLIVVQLVSRGGGSAAPEDV
jgi:hypothetical protein